MKTLRRNIPEISLLVLCIGLMIAELKINTVLLTTSLVLVALIITQTRWIGLTLGIITTFLSLFMMLAVLSEFREFPTVNREAITLVSVGLAIFLATFALSVLMIIKYIVPKVKKSIS